MSWVHAQYSAGESALNRNLCPPPVQDQALFAPVKVRVLKSFCVAGKTLGVGLELRLEAHVARSLAAAGRCEIIEQP